MAMRRLPENRRPRSNVLAQIIEKRLRIRSHVEGNKRIWKAYIDPYRATSIIGGVVIRDGLIYNFTVNSSYRDYGIGGRLFRVALNHPDLPPTLRLVARAELGGVSQAKLESFYAGFGFRRNGRVTDRGGVEMELHPRATHQLKGA